MTRRAAAWVALAATVVAAAGCGSSNPKLIPQSNADQLTASVDAISSACSNGDAAAVHNKVSDAQNLVLELPRRTDPQLKANLRQWLRHIDAHADSDCKAQPTPTPSPSETPTPTPTETPTPTPTPTATATPAPTATATPSATATPDTAGGVPAPTP